MSKTKKPQFDSCTVMRRQLVAHGTLDLNAGEVRDERREWVTRACNTPLFSEAERERGVCRSCAAGWKHPNNYPANEEQPAEATE